MLTPVREAANRELLWAGLRTRCSTSRLRSLSVHGGDEGNRQRRLGAAWGGISSLQLSPAAGVDGGAAQGVLAGRHRRLDGRAARPAGRPGREGPDRARYDADFCLFAPEESFVVDPGLLRTRHPVTPYAGRTLTGVVRGTMLRGTMIDLRRPQEGC